MSTEEETSTEAEREEHVESAESCCDYNEPLWQQPNPPHHLRQVASPHTPRPVREVSHAAVLTQLPLSGTIHVLIQQYISIFYRFI